jgi:hypothetical protein
VVRNTGVSDLGNYDCWLCRRPFVSSTARLTSISKLSLSVLGGAKQVGCSDKVCVDNALRAGSVSRSHRILV